MTVPKIDIQVVDNGFLIQYIDLFAPGMASQHGRIAKDIDTLMFDIRNLLTNEPTPIPEVFEEEPQTAVGRWLQAVLSGDAPPSTEGESDVLIF